MGEFEREIRRRLKKIPQGMISNLRARLLHEWTKVKEMILILPELKTKRYPALYFFGILAKDWPGLAEAAIGVITEMDWNIETNWGLAFDYKGERIAMMIFGIKAKDEEHLVSFLSRERELYEKLYKLCYKGWRKRILLAQGTKKVEKFEEVMEMIKQRGEMATVVAEEVTTFFHERGELYLEKHSSEYLVGLILTNCDFIEKVRKLSGKPQIKVEHFVCKDEKLTGITLASYERDFSLALALDALKEAVPSYNIIYNNEFVTDDGILVCGIEIDGFQPIQKIRDSIANRMRTKKFDRLRIGESFGGFEHYAKAIIPQLIKEFNLTKIPQVYLSPEFTSTNFIQFKLIIVKSCSSREWANRYIAKLEEKEGLTIVTRAVPSLYKDVEVNTLDLRAERSAFSTPEGIHIAIKEVLNSVLKRFRDFDEGVRKIEVERFKEIKHKLKDVNRTVLREFYYELESFYRINSPVSELVKIIKLGVKLSRGTAYLSRDTACRVPTIKLVRLDDSSFLLGIAGEEKILPQVLEILSASGGYKTLVNKIQIQDFEILLLKVEKTRGKLAPNALKFLKETLIKVL